MLKVSDRVATGIKPALDRAGIDMPYPHTVVLFHDTTGAREGDIEQEAYLAARNGISTHNGQIAERVPRGNRRSLHRIDEEQR